MSFFTCSSVAFLKKVKHTLCYRDTVKANLKLLHTLFYNKHREDSNLCHAEIIYSITDIVLRSYILLMLRERKADWFNLQSVLISKP